MKDVGGRPPKLTRDQADTLAYAVRHNMPVAVAAKIYGISETSARRYAQGRCRHYEAAA
jgi:hypothetical protein